MTVASAKITNRVPAVELPRFAAVGAHLTGMPLNGELKALGARLLEATSTAPDYRLYALAGSKPPKPGLLRVASGKGSAIAVEIWALRAESFGRFVAAVPSPLSIGTPRSKATTWPESGEMRAPGVRMPTRFRG